MGMDEWILTPPPNTTHKTETSSSSSSPALQQVRIYPKCDKRSLVLSKKDIKLEFQPAQLAELSSKPKKLLSHHFPASIIFQPAHSQANAMALFGSLVHGRRGLCQLGIDLLAALILLIEYKSHAKESVQECRCGSTCCSFLSFFENF